MSRKKVPPCLEGKKIFRRVTGTLGGQTSTAKILGIKQQSVFKWAETGRIPVEHLEALSRATGFSPAEIRPDLAAVLVKRPITSSHDTAPERT